MPGVVDGERTFGNAGRKQVQRQAQSGRAFNFQQLALALFQSPATRGPLAFLVIKGDAHDIRAGIIGVGKFDPERGNGKLTADLLGELRQRFGVRRLSFDGKLEEGSAVAVGQELDDPTRVGFSGIGFARAEKGGRSRHGALSQVSGHLPGVAQLVGSDRGIGPFRTFGIYRDVGGLTAEGELDAMFGEEFLSGGGGLVLPTISHLDFLDG